MTKTPVEVFCVPYTCLHGLPAKTAVHLFELHPLSVRIQCIIYNVPPSLQENDVRLASLSVREKTELE